MVKQVPYHIQVYLQQIQFNMAKKYIILNTSELDSLDFNELLNTSEDYVRKSTNGTKAIVSYEGTIPSGLSPSPLKLMSVLTRKLSLARLFINLSPYIATSTSFVIVSIVSS